MAKSHNLLLLMSVGYQTVKTFDCKSFVADYEFDYFNVVIVHLFLISLKNLVTVYI